MFKYSAASFLHAVLLATGAMIPGYINGDLSFMTWDLWVYITLCLQNLLFLHYRDGDKNER